MNISSIDKAKNDYETIVVTTKEGNVVVLSEEEYNNLTENLFIMSNPELVKRLNKSIQQLVKGDVVEVTLDDLKKMENE